MTCAWVLIAFAVAFIMVLPAMRTLAGMPYGEAKSSLLWEMASNVFVIAMMVVLVWAARLSGWPAGDYFGLAVPERRDVLDGFAVLAAATLIAAAINYSADLNRPNMEMLIADYRVSRSAGMLPFMWLSAIVVAPLWEEVMYRGFIYRGWSQTRLGEGGTIVLTSILFGLAHFQYTWLGMIDTAIFGLVVGWARWRTGSIVLPIILHAATNLIAMIYIAASAGTAPLAGL